MVCVTESGYALRMSSPSPSASPSVATRSAVAQTPWKWILLGALGFVAMLALFLPMNWALERLSRDMARVGSGMNSVSADFNRMSGSMQTIAGDVTGIAQGIAGMDRNFQRINHDVGEIQRDVRADLGAIRAGLGNMREDAAWISVDANRLDQSMLMLSGSAGNLSANTTQIRSDVQGMIGRFQEPWRMLTDSPPGVVPPRY